MYDIKQTRFMTKVEAKRCLAISETNLKHIISKGLMVPLISLGERSVGFIEQEVHHIMAARIYGKSNEEIQQLVQDLVAHRKSLSLVA
ncbi:helix-turn-helix transcriptional regulator [Glaciecola sp. 2405UD65-10]|uniref:helix-turn-helix transcriptional regulator n=1 Tax=Glaciecola sp. 2405UD65-10 TaxID=3397244 RepID=UPI003B5AFF01